MPVVRISPDGVHVLFEEMSRDNWARGAVLNVDRNGTQAEASSLGIATQSCAVVVQLDSAEVADGLAGTLRETAAQLPQVCRGLVIARDATETTPILVISTWATREAWLASPLAAACTTAGLTADIGVHAQLPQGGGLEGIPLVSRFLTVSTHTVTAAAIEQYLELRRIAVNPGMARLEGFVSSDVLRKLERPNEFFVVNQWTAKQWADEYAQSDLHVDLRRQVRALLDSHSGMREYLVEREIQAAHGAPVDVAVAAALSGTVSRPQD
jgi:heme-degrading monooxygenase HmoA